MPGPLRRGPGTPTHQTHRAPPPGSLSSCATAPARSASGERPRLGAAVVGVGGVRSRPPGGRRMRRPLIAGLLLASIAAGCGEDHAASTPPFAVPSGDPATLPKVAAEPAAIEAMLRER